MASVEKVSAILPTLLSTRELTPERGLESVLTGKGFPAAAPYSAYRLHTGEKGHMNVLLVGKASVTAIF